MKLALPGLSLSSQYSDYLRRLNARAVLDHYGLHNDHDEVTDRGETEVIHSCLLDQVDRHHNNGDANPSASCNLDRRLYICYSFWGGDLFHLVQKLENKDSFEGILPIIAPFLDGAVVEPDRFLGQVKALLGHHDAPTVNLPAYSERVLSPWAFVHPYLYERGIDDATASRLQVGWREDDNRIIIPHFWGGKLMGWQARAVPDRPGQWPGTADPQPKYKSTSGFPKSSTLYYDHSRPFPSDGSDVLVVESPFSVIKAVALGVEMPVVATFGSKVSPTQVELIDNFRRIWVWADPDPAGVMMERTLLRRLGRSRPHLRFVTPDPGQDLADCTTHEQIETKIEQATPALLRTL